MILMVMSDSYRAGSVCQRIVFLISCLMLSLSVKTLALEPSSLKDDKPEIVTRISNNSPYCNEPVVIDTYLYSRHADIQYVEPLSLPYPQENGENTRFLIFPVETDRGVFKEQVGKEILFKVNVSKFVLIPLEAGKLVLPAPSFKIGIPHKVLRSDPFWGDYVAYDVENIECEGKGSAIKAKKLPDYKGEGKFSGCVGDFTISAYLPPGRITHKNEATFVVEIEGTGWIPDDSMPEVRNAFGKTAKLRSVSENRNRSLRESNLYSELELVCEFIPEGETEFEIGPVEFVFFNPSSGKYQTIYSETVRDTYSGKKTKGSSGELMEI